MTEFKSKLGAITMNTLIPISLVIVIGGIIFFIGGLASKVEAIQKNESPSRSEYNQMCQQLSEIKKGVDEINRYLLTSKN